MINAGLELLKALEGTGRIKCALVNFMGTAVFKLEVGYTESEFSEFINNLDFLYDSGSVVQLLFGNVWFEDGTWLERNTHDGFEWWEFKCYPPIPNILLEKTLN